MFQYTVLIYTRLLPYLIVRWSPYPTPLSLVVQLSPAGSTIPITGLGVESIRNLALGVWDTVYPARSQMSRSPEADRGVNSGRLPQGPTRVDGQRRQDEYYIGKDSHRLEPTQDGELNSQDLLRLTSPL